MQQSESNNLKKFLLITLGIHIWPLLNKGLFWDDWFWHFDKLAQERTLWDLGNPILSHLTFYITQNAYGVFLGKLTIVLSTVFCALFFYLCLKKINSFTREQIVNLNNDEDFFLALLFMSFPAFFARSALSCLGYCVCLLWFYSALYFFLTSNKNPFRRILSLLLFFLSFAMNSLLVLYIIIPILLIVKNDLYQNFHLTRIKKTFLKYLDFLLLPFFFWVIKKTFFTPHQSFKAYNSLSPDYLTQLPKNLILALAQSNLFPLFLFLLFVIGAIISKKIEMKKLTPNRLLQIFIVGLFLLLMAIIPYLLVGKIPRNFDWDSRHQALIPLGASLSLFALIKIISESFSNKIFKLLSWICVLIFGLQHLNAYYQYQKDWYKQKSLIHSMRSIKEIKLAGPIIFIDKTTWPYAMKRYLRSYEYHGLLISAFRNKNHIGSYNLDELQELAGKIGQGSWGEHLYQDFKPGEYLITYVEIEENRKPNFFDILQLIFLERFRPQEFSQKVKTYLKLGVSLSQQKYSFLPVQSQNQ